MMFGRRKPSKQADDLTLQVERAEQQRSQAQAERPAVDSLVKKLKGHLAENSFADRLYEQMIHSRREA